MKVKYRIKKIEYKNNLNEVKIKYIPQVKLYGFLSEWYAINFYPNFIEKAQYLELGDGTNNEGYETEESCRELIENYKKYREKYRENSIKQTIIKVE